MVIFNSDAAWNKCGCSDSKCYLSCFREKLSGGKIDASLKAINFLTVKVVSRVEHASYLVLLAILNKRRTVDSLG